QAKFVHCVSNLNQWGIIWLLYAGDYKDSFSQGYNVGWARGEWVKALRDHYEKKPEILLCPEATARRGAGARETLVAVGSSSAVAYGGPRSCYEFPLVDQTQGPGKLLLSSYGLNHWVDNSPPCGT